MIQDDDLFPSHSPLPLEEVFTRTKGFVWEPHSFAQTTNTILHCLLRRIVSIALPIVFGKMYSNDYASSQSYNFGQIQCWLLSEASGPKALEKFPMEKALSDCGKQQSITGPNKYSIPSIKNLPAVALSIYGPRKTIRTAARWNNLTTALVKWREVSWMH